jgi:hypothetical protein
MAKMGHNTSLLGQYCSHEGVLPMVPLEVVEAVVVVEAEESQNANTGS